MNWMLGKCLMSGVEMAMATLLYPHHLLLPRILTQILDENDSSLTRPHQRYDFVKKNCYRDGVIFELGTFVIRTKKRKWLTSMTPASLTLSDPVTRKLLKKSALIL